VFVFGRHYVLNVESRVGDTLYVFVSLAVTVASSWFIATDRADTKAFMFSRVHVTCRVRMIPYVCHLCGTSFRKWWELQKLSRRHTSLPTGRNTYPQNKKPCAVLHSTGTVVGLCNCVSLCVFKHSLVISC